MKKSAENFLDKVPHTREDIKYTQDDQNIVTLNIENKGVFNTIAQKLFKKPKICFPRAHLGKQITKSKVF